MKAVKKINIDAEKLRHEILIRNLTLDKISVDTGHSVSYMSVMLTRKSMPVTQAVLIEHLYGIMRADYEAVDKPTECAKTRTENTSGPNQLDYDKLYATIYTAVYQALRSNAEEMKDRLFIGETNA